MNREEFLYVCESGDIVKVRELIRQGANNIWGVGFQGACQGGHTEIAELMMERDEDCVNCHMYGYNEINESMFEYGFQIGCYHGHMNIVKLMISKLDMELEIDFWNLGLEYACEELYEGCKYDANGRIDIINLILSKGSTTEEHLPKEYTDYKHAQLLKYTKMHESLVTMIKM